MSPYLWPPEDEREDAEYREAHEDEYEKAVKGAYLLIAAVVVIAGVVGWWLV